MNKSEELQKRIEKVGINKIKRHIFLCTGDKCCSAQEGEDSWQALKEATRSEGALKAGAGRTKVGCLRICAEGPVAVVYPEGVWYRNMTPDAVKTVVEKHMIQGEVVQDLVITVQPLKPD